MNDRRLDFAWKGKGSGAVEVFQKCLFLDETIVEPFCQCFIFTWHLKSNINSYKLTAN